MRTAWLLVLWLVAACHGAAGPRAPAVTPVAPATPTEAAAPASAAPGEPVATAATSAGAPAAPATPASPAVAAAGARSPTAAGEDRGGLDPVEPWPRDRHWWRAIGQASLLIGVMEVKYWIDKELNRFDFQYDLDWHNVRERFITLEAWRLDDNFFNTNGWRHTAQGGANYLFARSNGFSALESYVFSLAASTVWELAGEYKEEVSVNDLIMTPRSGFVVGEAFWHLGVFLLRSEPHWANQILGNAFSFGTGVLQRIDGEPRWRARVTGPLGLDASLPHRFESGLAVGRQEATGDDAQGVLRAVVETDLVMIPGFERPGRARRLHTDPAFSQVRVAWTWGEHDVIDFEAFARAAVTSWHHKRVDARGRGHNLLLGLASAYEYGFHAARDRDQPRTRDRLAIAHVIGPALDLWLRAGHARLRVGADLYGDYALVRNHAIDDHRALYPDEEVRSTVLRDNYHHAFGVTAHGRVTATYRGLEARLAYRLDRFRSIQGLDRHQDEIVDDYVLHDGRREGRLWLGYRVDLGLGLALRLEAGIETRYRTGTVKTTTRATDERRYLGGLRLEL